MKDSGWKYLRTGTRRIFASCSLWFLVSWKNKTKSGNARSRDDQLITSGYSQTILEVHVRVLVGAYGYQIDRNFLLRSFPVIIRRYRLCFHDFSRKLVFQKQLMVPTDT